MIWGKVIGALAGYLFFAIAWSYHRRINWTLV